MNLIDTSYTKIEDNTMWQNLPSHIDPVIISIGSFSIHYYGLMYIVAISLSYFLTHYRIKHENLSYNKEDIESLYVWGVIGMLLGARLGYVLFYDFTYFMTHPLQILLPFKFEGGFTFTGFRGMSYHGGALGAALSAYIYIRRHKFDFFELADLVTPTLAIGYTFGRIGNFINGELYGRVTDSAIGMYFPRDGSKSLRHPSQLYEAFFEGIVLFTILWLIKKNKHFKYMMLPLYFIGYGFFRFFIEFFREPDAHLGFIAGPFSMGQLLCILMMIGGLLFALIIKKFYKKSQ
ncbi:MAG: prolipoprotein diacylglyceryl transferase [Spirochaetes bacterium]|nr:prolipoprotein diacylglyceryl transferase [Spirochaetota bacterium]MBN2770293.1 prolipoprotein diacylglyceryl transferase [Spirochaetota bacterium]